MQFTRLVTGPALVLALSTFAAAQDPSPGSVLVYPSVRDTGARTVVSVTNTSPTLPVLVRFSYVSVVPSTSPPDPLVPADCLIDETFHLLTPSDTITLATICDNPNAPLDGYLVIDARDTSGTNAISHNYLVGSQFVAQGPSATYSLAAISFQALEPDGDFTDIDADGELDFDGVEYTECAESLIIDTFLASIGNRLALINLTGGTAFTATAAFTIFNDNEQPFSLTRNFRCWFDRPLDSLGPAFTLAFLLGTAHDPSEFDVDCDGTGDLETGWSAIRGSVAFTVDQTITMPAFLGAVTGTTAGFERGRPLWRVGRNDRGDFLGTATIHPEY